MNTLGSSRVEHRLVVVSCAVVMLVFALAANAAQLIGWNKSLQQLEVDSDDYVGQRFTWRCAPQQMRYRNAIVSGTGSYTSDSALCLAALHAGVLNKTGGAFTVQLNPGASQYIGSSRRGVTSSNFPATQRSIKFIPNLQANRLDAIQCQWAPSLRWDTKFTRTGLANRNLVGQSLLLRCPPVSGKLPQRVAGTDDYAFDSFVCLAAVHAGRMTYAGGLVRVRIDRSNVALRGSIRNGITSHHGGNGQRSISFPTLGSRGCLASR